MIESLLARDVALAIRPFVDGLEAGRPLTDKDGKRRILGFPVAGAGYRQFMFTDVTLTGTESLILILVEQEGQKLTLSRR